MKYISILTASLILSASIYASENVPTKEEVTKLYVATFNRAPDTSGLNYWVDGDLKLSQIAKSFFDQPETREFYPTGTSNRDFIKSIYLNLFNRLPEIGGWNYWETQLENKAFSKNSAIQAIINGALGDDAVILENKKDVGLYFVQNNLSDNNKAKLVMSGITSNVDSVEFIKDKIANNNINENTWNSYIKSTISSEPYYKYLWHIDSKNSKEQKISQEVSSYYSDEYTIGAIDENADMNILDAWNITKGKGVIVAVIDDGGDVEHEDLKANIYLAYNADNGTNDISNKSNDIEHASHGNTCAGFIVAPINSKGIIGTAPEAKLIIIKQDENDDVKAIKAFEYAKDNGAKVISCSWGSGEISEALTAELKSLYEAGITVVFASGNDGKSLDDGDEYVDESEVSWVIGIGASGENNDVTTYSNYGKNIDVLASGGDSKTSLGILGLDDSATQGSNENYALVSNNYAFTNGTSFATPVTAGIVALMYGVNPNITPKQVRDILISTADKVGGTNANYLNGFDTKRAYGKINATKAVEEAKKLVK